MNPVVLVLDALPKICKDEKLNSYVISVFGSVEACRYGSSLFHVLLDAHNHYLDVAIVPGCCC